MPRLCVTIASQYDDFATGARVTNGLLFPCCRIVTLQVKGAGQGAEGGDRIGSRPNPCPSLRPGIGRKSSPRRILGREDLHVSELQDLAAYRKTFRPTVARPRLRRCAARRCCLLACWALMNSRCGGDGTRNHASIHPACDTSASATSPPVRPAAPLIRGMDARVCWWYLVGSSVWSRVNFAAGSWTVPRWAGARVRDGLALAGKRGLGSLPGHRGR